MKFVLFHSNYEYIKFLYGKSKTSYDVINIFDYSLQSGNWLLRFLYRVHISPAINKYISLPLKSFWYRFMLPKGLSRTDEICFVFNSSRVAGIDVQFYNYLRQEYKCKLVMQLWNPVDWDRSKGGYDIEKMKDIMDLVCTYNKIDVEKYKLVQYPYILFNLLNINIKPLKDRTVDVFFLGQDKGRMGFIESLYEKLTSLGLNCEFYIVNPQNEPHCRGIHICDWMPYHKLIEITENSKCIVNILQPGAEGVTIRDIEAYNYGCFMITNNKSKELHDIYNNEQLIDINQINESTVNVIKKRNEVFPPRNNFNSLDNYYNWLFNILYSYNS